MIDVSIDNHCRQCLLGIARRKLTPDMLLPKIGKQTLRAYGSLSAEMANEKFERPQICQLGGPRVKMRSAGTGKSVILIRVVMNCNQRVRVQRLMDLNLRLWRTELIPARYMEHQ